MKLRHVKVVWGAAEVIKGDWHLGLFGLYDRGEGKHDAGFAISVRGALLWLLAAAVAAYLAFATALFWFWQRNPYSLLTFTDALLRPVRREEVRDKQGQAFIAEGTDALRAKKWSEGVALLRQGLAFHSNDLRARLTLAQFYVMANQRPIAVKLLQEGLGGEFPGRAYLQGLFDTAEQGENFDLVVQTCDRYLPQLKGDAAARDRRWMVSRQFTALLAAPHFTEALGLAEAEEPGDMANEHRVLALFGLGRSGDALAFLDEWGARPGADARQILRLRVRALREARRFDDMERALVELHAKSPADPRSIVYGVVQRAMAGRDEPAKAALEDYLFRFGGSTQNVQLVAEPLAEIGNLPLLERCIAAAAERGYPAAPFQVLQVQTCLQCGDWAGAARTLAAIKPRPPAERDAAQAQLWREWMQRLLDAATVPGEAAGTAVVEFLRSRPWPIKIYRRSIDVLRLAGRLETARDVIAVAGGAFPASAWMETQKTEVARALAARQQALTDVPVVAAGKLPGEKLYFQRLDDALRTEQWPLAEQMLHEARAAKPSPGWLGARDGDLRLAQVRISHGQGDALEMIAAAKIYLNGENERSRQVIDFARAVFAQGDRSSALALAREVLRKSPDYPPALRLLNEWQPKPAVPQAKKK